MGKLDVTTAYQQMNGLYPKFRVLVEATLEQANRETKGKFPGFARWCVIETFRHPKRQAYLYAQGRTRPGAKVTWTLKSRHISGLAVDIVPLKTNGGIWWDAPDDLWKILGHAARTNALVWGGNWKKQDKPHVEANVLQFATWAVPARLHLVKEGLL